MRTPDPRTSLANESDDSVAKTLKRHLEGAAGGDALAAFRAALFDAGYPSPRVAELRRLHRFLPSSDSLSIPASSGVDDRAAAMVRLLALGQRLDIGDALRALPETALEDLETVGLLTVGDDHVTANCCLLPQERLLLAGDRTDAATRDQVHPFTEPSLMLARMMPRIPMRSMLDVGTGSGILALLGAPHCESVTATDINPRALMFAGFNADLNEVRNIELLEGNWFEPIGDRRFDLIVANPPYTVSPEQEFTYRDSGLPPGVLLETVCRGAAAHLEPAGLAIFLCSWPHRAEEDWASLPTAAVRDSGCDAVILHLRELDPLEYAIVWNTPPVRFLDLVSLRRTIARWLGYYTKIGAGKISFGGVALKRRDSGQPWVNALNAPATFGDRAAEQLLRLFPGHEVGRTLDHDALLSKCFALPPGTDVSQRFQRESTGFSARMAVTSLSKGLGTRAAVDPDSLEVLFACDGTRPLGEIVDELAVRRHMDVGQLATLAVDAMRELLAQGLVDVA